MAAMTDSETLSSLVEDCHRRPGVTVRSFHARAIDPKSKYQPSTHNIGRIAKGELVQMNPKLVAALAAALGSLSGVSPERVEAAATRQYITNRVTDTYDVGGQLGAVVTTVHKDGTEAVGPRGREIIARLERDHLGD